jgi:hypothetical protein
MDINFHKSATELNVLVAQGYRSKELKKNKLCFSPKDVPGISGTVELAERINQTTLVTIRFQVPAGGSHPAHIHENNVATTGENLFTRSLESCRWNLETQVSA